MTFPVDLLADVSQAELQRLAQNYMNDLLYGNPDSPERLNLADSSQITIDISSVGFIPLYGSCDQHRVLALFAPSDPLTAVALYLLDQWWTVDDILKTADPARDGPVEVETVGERIVLYILNRVVYRAKEMRPEELPFLCHGENDHAKILWSDGEAVGFYSVKPSGSLCNSFSNRSYQLPVMDSVFVRKRWRGKGFGLLMLEDFVLSYRDDHLGLRYPLSMPMYKVCEKYLCQYPGDTDLLWEVEGAGRPNQRTKISSKIQTIDLSVSKSLSFTEEPVLITEVTEKETMEDVITQIKEPTSVECTVETVEEVAALRETKEAELLVSARGRSSGSKRLWNLAEKITESEKVIRIEDIEAETPREENVPAQQKTEIQDVSKVVHTEAIFIVAPEENGEHVADPTPEGDTVIVSDTAATILASQDLDEADVTSGSATEEPQVVDTSQSLTSTSRDSQITVENVSSDIEKDCLNEDTPVLVISEEVLEAHKEAEPIEKSGEVSDEKFEQTVTQHELNELTHTTSGDDEAGKTVKAIKTVQSETPILRSQPRLRPEEELMEESTAQEGGRLLRTKTVMIKHTPKRRHTRHDHEEETEEQREALVQDTEPTKSSTDTDTEHVSTEGSKEPPTQEAEHMADADLKAGGFASEEMPADERMGEHHQVQPEETDGTEEMAAEDVIPSTEASVIDADKEPEANDATQEMPDEVLTWAAEKDTTSETPRLQKAAVTAVSQGEDLEPEMDAVAEEEQDVVEEQSETISKTTAHEEETSGEECNETQPAMGGKTVEPSPVLSDEEPITMAEEEERPAGLIAVKDAVHEGASLPKAAVLPPSEDKKTVSAEEQQSKGPAPQLSDLQRVTVVLVDLKKTHHDIHKEMATVNQDVPVETPAVEIEEEQREDGMKAEEKTEEHSPGSPDGLEKPELEKAAVKEEGFGDGVEDAATIQETGDVKAKETVQEYEAESPYDEEEPTISKTRPRRSMRQAAKPTPSSKLPKSQRKRDKKKETSDSGEEEPLLAVSSETAADEEDEESSPADEMQVEEPEAQENIDENNKEEPEEESTPTDVEEPKADDKDDRSDEIMDVEEPIFQREVTSETEVEIPVGESVVESLDRGEGKVTDDEETPVVVLRSGGKTVKATSSSKTSKSQQDDEQETVVEKSSDAEQPAVETRALRKGWGSAATTPTRRTKRARTGAQQDEEEATQSEETPVEETKANNEEKMEEQDDQEPVVQEEKTEPELESNKVGAVEPPVTGDETAEAESAGANTEEDTPVVQQVEEPSNTHEEEDTDEEEAPVVETRALRRGWRSAAAVIPRHKSRRTRTRRQPEELRSPAEVEEPKADDKDDHSDEITEEKNAEKPVVQKENNSEPEVDMREGQAVVEQSVSEQETAEEEEPPVPETTANVQEEIPVGESVEEEEAPVVETRVLRSGGKAGKATPSSKTSENEEGTEVENSSDTEEPAVETRALRKGRRSAATTSTRRSKRARTGAQQEEEEGVVGEAVTETEMNKPGEVEEMKRASTEEAAAPEEAIVADESVATGETPAVSGTFREEEAKDWTETQQPELKEQAETDETEAKEVQPENSHEENVRNNTGTAESTTAKGNVLNLVLDTDEEAETKVSSQELEGVASDEEADPSVTRKKVLRGRKVPSLSVTPRPPSRRHTSQVQVSEESLSDEDEGPVPALRSLRKRKSRGATPARKSQRLSRV